MLQTARRSIRFWDRVAETPVDIPVSATLKLAGFHEWAQSDDFPESGRISYLAGEIQVDMSPEEYRSHHQVKRGLYRGWERFLDEFDVADMVMDGMLLVNEEADLGTEADGLLCLWESIESGRVRIREVVEGTNRFVEVFGSPDVAAEIVSRSSAHKDKVLLMDLYYRAGVSEYWLIDAQSEDIDFRIFLRGDRQFEQAEADAEGFVFSRVLQRSFRMRRHRDRGGNWRYTLQYR